MVYIVYMGEGGDEKEWDRRVGEKKGKVYLRFIYEEGKTCQIANLMRYTMPIVVSHGQGRGVSVDGEGDWAEERGERKHLAQKGGWFVNLLFFCGVLRGFDGREKAEWFLLFLFFFFWLKLFFFLKQSFLESLYEQIIWVKEGSGKGIKAWRKGVRMYTLSPLSRSSSTGTHHIYRVNDIILYTICKTSITSIESAISHRVPPDKRASHPNPSATMATMTDYIFRHASAYPPPTWAFLTNHQSKPSSNNKLWIEMTSQYKQSMAKRQQLVLSNQLSETATDKQIAKMSPEVKKLHRRKFAIAFAFEDAAQSGDVLKNAGRFLETLDELTTYPMNTIPEDESRTTDPNRLPNEKEFRKIKKAIGIMQYHGSLLASPTKIEDSFSHRLMDIHNIYHMFICTKVGHTPRPRWAQICRLDREVNDHVARVAHAEQQLKSDVTHLRSFLREQLFDEYCLMRGTPMEMKNETWMRYGKYLMSEHEIGKSERSLSKESR